MSLSFSQPVITAQVLLGLLAKRNLYRTSWFSQNLSSRALNVFKVGDETMLSGKLFHNGIIRLEKLNLRILL